MKALFLLSLLFLLGSCNNNKLGLKIGDCIRIYSSVHVRDFLVVDIFKDKIIVSPAFKNKLGEPTYLPGTKYVFRHAELNEKAKIIKCSEVE